MTKDSERSKDIQIEDLQSRIKELEEKIGELKKALTERDKTLSKLLQYTGISQGE